MKVLTPQLHGILDYASVVLLALAPSLFGSRGICLALRLCPGRRSLDDDSLHRVPRWRRLKLSLFRFTASSRSSLAWR